MGERRFRQGHKLQTCFLPAQYHFIEKLAEETGNTLAATNRHIVNSFMMLYNKAIEAKCEQCIFDLIDEVEKIFKNNGVLKYGKNG